MTTIRKWTAVLPLWLCFSLALGSTSVDSKVAVPKLDLHETKLANGLRVIIVPDHTAPVYAICVTYDVGSRNERPGRTGFAHLFEHMMFQGSENVGKQEHDILIFNNGGSANGTTNEDRTNYFEALPKNQLDLGLFLESDRMRALNLTQANFDNQRKTVQEERRQRVDNQPYGRTSLEIDNLAYDNFAYKHSTIGSMSDLDRATIEDVREFFRIYYAPNNAVLTLVGDLDPEETLVKVKKYFGSIPSGPPAPKVDLLEEPHDGERRETIQDPLARLPQIDIAYHIPRGNTPENYAVQQLASILGQGESSRLYQHLVKERQLASKVSASAESRIGTSQLYISANPRPGVKIEDLGRAIDEEIAALVKAGVTADELSKTKAQILRRFIEQRRSDLSVATQIGRYAVYFDDPNLINSYLDKQDAVTVDQVGASAKKYLLEDQRTVVITLAGGPVQTSPAGASAQAQDTSAPTSKVVRLNRAPVNAEILRLKLPRPIVVKLRNGLTLLLVPDHKLPTVAFTLWIRPGQLADPKELPGVSSFTAGMLREGTERRSSAEIAREVDSLGASLVASSVYGASYTSLGASGLSNHTSEILDLLSDVALNPAFPEDELRKFKQRAQANLESNLANPIFLGQQAFRRVLYGDTPMAITSPTKESIEKVTRLDLKRFHDQHYRPGNAILGVTGDFKSNDMRALVEKYFSAWTGASQSPLTFASTETQHAPKITLVDRPGSVQTYLVGGNRALRRTDPDYYRLEVMNEILGGGPQARLFINLREEHGYTYGAYSRINSELYPGDWSATASVRTPVTDGSMTQFLYEFKRITTEPVPQSELDDAHRSIIAALAFSLEQPTQVLNDWLTVEHFGLPLDYWDKYPDHIAAIDIPTVQAAAKKYVDLDHLQWIAVGDAKQIKDVLSKYGPITVVGAAGSPE
jgi:zinc protease